MYALAGAFFFHMPRRCFAAHNAADWILSSTHYTYFNNLHCFIFNPLYSWRQKGVKKHLAFLTA